MPVRHGPLGPGTCQAKLVRWHQLPCQTLGTDLAPLLATCPSLASLDLSHFYCRTKDLIPALKDHPATAASLACLDLLSASSVEGFHASKLAAIAAACPNLHHFLTPVSSTPATSTSSATPPSSPSPPPAPTSPSSISLTPWCRHQDQAEDS